MLRAVKKDLIADILTRETTGCDVGECKVTGTTDPYIGYYFTGIAPTCFASGRARKTLHIGNIDIYANANPEAVRERVNELLEQHGIKTSTLSDGYDLEYKRWLLRIQFRYTTLNPEE